ncbi:MAG: orotidine-5'-phosphate decarboxylase [Candidatus Omnitrophica bacterium]|nr:orotidine-5'-phosphate decarboxylase [Candidatus Omnitrophota bacterium]
MEKKKNHPVVPRKDRVIAALDVEDRASAKRILSQLKGKISIFKVGMELFTSQGPRVIDWVHRAEAKVFLDLKFHDIPNTVAAACKMAVRLGVFMMNVHTSGGSVMMKWAVEHTAEEARRLGIPKPMLIGVTVLTSLTEQEIRDEIGIERPLKEEVLHLAGMAQRAGLDGVVASAHEIEAIKKKLKNFTVVTPGIRPEWYVTGSDQKRVMTPKMAFDAGADYIVIGRPIVQDPKPAKACEKIFKELE